MAISQVFVGMPPGPLAHLPNLFGSSPPWVVMALLAREVLQQSGFFGPKPGECCPAPVDLSVTTLARSVSDLEERLAQAEQCVVDEQAATPAAEGHVDFILAFFAACQLRWPVCDRRSVLLVPALQRCDPQVLAEGGV